jgi:hypothetical protein
MLTAAPYFARAQTYDCGRINESAPQPTFGLAVPRRDFFLR